MVEASKKTVFITGINGFTGVHLEQHLQSLSYDVFGTVLHSSKNQNHFSCDILNEDDLFKVLNQVRPDYIFHLAAVSFVASKNQKKIYNVNIFGTLNLLKAVERLNYIPKKILIASSAAVYGNIEGELSEEMCPKPVNHYGNSKLVMENMTKGYFDKQNIIIVRPFNYTGVGQESHFLIPKIVSHFKENKKTIELGNIDVYREFNSVEFVVRSYLELVISDLKSEIINVCTGNAINIKSILSKMKKLAGYEIEVRINPVYVRKNEIKILKGSPEKINSLVKKKLKDYSLERTLKEMYHEKTH